jgi:ribonuclease P protein component
VFARVFAKHQRYSRGVLQLYVHPNQCGKSRLGMAISRSAAGTAVRRNRLKRLTRETFRQLSASLGGVDLVVNINRPMTAAAFKTYAKDLHSLLEKARQCAPR